MLYDYQFPMWLLRQSSWLLWTGQAHAAVTQGIISALVLTAYTANVKPRGSSAAKKPQDAATTVEPAGDPDFAKDAEVEPEAAEDFDTEAEDEQETEPIDEAEEEAELEPEAEPAEEPEPADEAKDEPEPEPVDPTLSFDDVSWSIEYEQADSGRRLFPLLKLSGRVTNTSSEALGANALPQLSFMDGRDFLSLILDGGEGLQPGESKFVSVSKAFPVWDKWSFAFRAGEIKAILDGLDGIAEAITQEFAQMADGIEDAQKALDQERLSKGFVFEDVSYDIENVENIDGDSHYMAPMLEFSAKVTNTSDEKRTASDLPALECANNTEAFALDSDFEGGETKDVSLSVLFGQNADECTISFTEAEDKPVYSGLEGVAEELTQQLADAIAHLHDDQAELEAAILEEQAEQEEQAEGEAETSELEQAEAEEQEPEAEEEPEVETEAEPEEEPEAEAEALDEPEADDDVAEAEEEAEAKPEPDPDEPEQDEEPMCWITSAGEKYHLDPNCRYVRGNELSKITIAEATEMGRTVCKGCDH